MDSNLDYRIGLDIGIASVGWAALLNSSKGEPIHIIDMGVRIFDKAENPKTGMSLAAPRREARTTRRRLQRRRHRLERIRWLLCDEGIIRNIDAFMERYHSPSLPNVYRLRYEALDRLLEDEELAQILIFIAKHRGFHSTRKSELKDKDNGVVLQATSSNKELMEAKGYRTVGEMIYLDEKFRKECSWVYNGYILTPRNKSENYQHTILRSMLVDEVKYIFNCQRKLGNKKATQCLEEKYIDILTSQRSFDIGPGLLSDGSKNPYSVEGFESKVGKCTFEKEELRAAKATYTAEYFVALQKISHIRLENTYGEKRNFSDDERHTIINLLHTQKAINYTTVRKKLNLEENIRFYNLNYSSKKSSSVEEQIKDTEKVNFISMPFFHEYKKCLENQFDVFNDVNIPMLMDKVGHILTCYKNDDSRTAHLKEIGMNDETIDKLLLLNPSKFQHLSIKAMRKIIPYLEDGLTYDKACLAAGYDFKGDSNCNKLKLLKDKNITEIINEITNPVVKRSVSQTVKVLNAIILKYGSPQAVNVELAREMAKNFNDRQKLEKEMEDNQKNNEAIKRQIQELGIQYPNGQDIIKYRLWLEQGNISMYSGEPILLERLFDKQGGYDVDHILPYSITFDDSFNNKVLVEASENRQKGNRTPFEYFGEDTERWNNYETLVANTIKNSKKRDRLLKKHITSDERNEFKERNLNDTKYITTVVYNMINNYLELKPFNDTSKKKQVWAVNGSITSYLRKRWGMPLKDRSTDIHHAMDAVVIACCTDGMIQKITRYTQGRELRFARGIEYVDEETGEIFSPENMSHDEWDEIFGVMIPLPWNTFKTELEVRFGDNPKEFLDTHLDVSSQIDYPNEIYNEIRPIFVSRMPNHKIGGAAHKETIRSPRHFEDEGIVITKTALKDLKLKDGEIEGYYNKESDILLYNALKARLEAYNN
jgi:CRISPR-associated endonuclease Csn1